jgi:hypothetical protein
MATNFLVLGQTAPSATTNSTLYTAPSSTQAVLSTIFVCNRGDSAAAFRIAVRPNGASLQNQHYLFYDNEVDAKATIAITTGVTLGDTDVVTVYATSASLSFSAFGSEVTP